MARSLRRLLVLAAGALALAAPACAFAAATIGIDDPRASTFGDPVFKALGIRYARLVIPWDTPPDARAVDRWMREAKAQDVEPLVAFEHSAGDNCPSSPCTLPTVDQYGAAFDAFRSHYPDAVTFSPWNEENHPSQPTAASPQRAADYYNLIRAHCPSCVVVAADVLGTSDAPAWIAEFRRFTADDPQLWGLHNYPDLNYFTDAGTKAFAAAVPGEIWLTETGGVVSFTRPDGRVVLPYDEQRAANALTYLFQYLLPTYGQRVDRVYVHEWRTSPYSLFDSGLISPGGTPRPALDVLRAALPAPPAGTVPAGSAGAGQGVGAAPVAGAVPTTRQVLQLLRLRVGRTARATLRCSDGPNVCYATIRLLTADPLRARGFLAPMRVTVSHVDIAIRPGATKVVTLRLSKAGLRLANRRKLHRLAVFVTAGPRHNGFPRRALTRTWLEVP